MRLYTLVDIYLLFYCSFLRLVLTTTRWSSITYVRKRNEIHQRLYNCLKDSQ
jgi:hypothetical protein